jgi:hypothetical protein
MLAIPVAIGSWRHFFARLLSRRGRRFYGERMKRPCGACNRVEKGKPYTLSQCRHCWNFWHDPAWRALFDGDGPTVPIVYYSPCAIAPLRSIRLPFPDDAIRFNCSLLEWRGLLWLAWRQGWSGAKLGLCKLDQATYQPLDWGLHIMEAPATRHDAAGREDPRLFTFGGERHVAYTGVEYSGGGITTHCCYGRIERGELVNAHCPDLPGRNGWEKNWGFFDAGDGVLRAVHTIAPHRVVTIADGHAAFSHEMPFAPAWHPWGLRGGASPVRVGSEFYSFFHGWQQAAGRRIYCLGLYTFDARPPFAPKRIVPGPILLPDQADRQGSDVDVVYPGGAILRDGKWVIAGGYYDRECRIWEFDTAAIEALLQPVEAGAAPTPTTPRTDKKRIVWQPAPCRFRGEPTGKSKPCWICGQTDRSKPTDVPLLACGVHGTCTVRYQLPQVACCQTCRERQA